MLNPDKPTSSRRPTSPAARASCVESLESRSYLSAVVPSQTTRVMALGDSITAGLAFNGAYRLPLQQQLKAAGYKFNFVGSGTALSRNMADPQHEGHSGYEMIANNGLVPWATKPAAVPTGGRQIYGDVIRKAITTHKPDVVLLMIGVNDMRSLDTLKPADRAAEYRLVLDQIFQLAPKAKVIAAPPTYKRGLVDDARMEALGAAQKSVVDAVRKRGFDVQWAPNAGGGANGSIAPSAHDLADGIHPAAADPYARIANGFFNAIVEGTAGNANKAPQVWASTKAVVTAANAAGVSKANLNVLVGDDGKTKVVTKKWTKVSGPGGVTFADATRPATTATFNAPGQYQLRLTVSDGKLKVTKDVVVVAAAKGKSAVPAAPTNVKATRVAAGVFRLDWKDNATNETDFLVEASSDPAFKSNRTETVVPGGRTNFVVYPKVGGTLHYFRVRALNAAGASGNSGAASVRT